MGIFEGLTHKEELEKAIRDYTSLTDSNRSMYASLENQALQLYDLRKSTLVQIQEIKAYISNLQNCPQFIINGSNNALGYCENIQKAWDFENAPHDVNSNDGTAANAAMAGAAVVGGAVATAGPTIAMAIATTFGTASTGAAISSLGGAAAVNAALAWIGGGAVALGGGGMAAGSSLLAWLGPVGWGIAGVAGVALVGKSYWNGKKNMKQIEEITKYIQDEKKKQNIFSKMMFAITQIIDHTVECNNKLSLDILPNTSNDYESELYPKQLLIKMVEDAKVAGKLTREAVDKEGV